MKKAIIAIAAVLLVAALAAGVRTSGVVGGSQQACAPPITKLNTELDASVKVLEAYIAKNIAPLYAHPAKLSWSMATYVPTVKPGLVKIAIAVGEDQDPFGSGGFYGPSRLYDVTMVRECAGGDWKVTEFKRQKDQPAEPVASRPKPA